MNAAASVTATFMQASFTLTVNKAGTGGGSVTSSPAGINCGTTCSVSFTSGTIVTLTAAPVAGSTFTGWSGGGCTGTGTCVVTLIGATSVTATFNPATTTFTDDPLVAGTTFMKATHVTELRTAVNAARTRNGLAAAAWTDPALTPGLTTIKAVHITELRAALNAVYTKLGRTLPTYTDPTLGVGTTSKAAHIQELRTFVSSLP